MLASALLPPARAEAVQYYSIFLTAGRPDVPTLSVAIPPRTYPPRAQEYGVPLVLARPFNGNPGTRQPFETDWRQQWRIVCNGVPYSGPGIGPLPPCRFINRDSEGRRTPGGGPSWCMDISGPSSANGTRVHQWSCHAGDSQLWSFTRTQLVNKYGTDASGVRKCLDVTGFDARADNPAKPLQIWACSTGWNQQFRLRKADPAPVAPGTPQEPR
jgi:hypothetical protein